MPLFRRVKVRDQEYVQPYDPAPSAVSREIFTYEMDDFKARLGLRDNPHKILVVHVRWDGRVEVQMIRLRATGCIRRVHPLVRKGLTRKETDMEQTVVGASSGYPAFVYGLREFQDKLGIRDDHGQVLEVRVDWPTSRVAVIMSNKVVTRSSSHGSAGVA